jgi:hypothetical protein
MKRSKARGTGDRRDEDNGTDFWAKPVPEELPWEKAVEGQADAAFAPYALTTRYAKGQLVSHAKFGRGVVVDAEASRVEILFQDGKKKLGHGQV